MAADKLSFYQAKRDFTKTAEPSGQARVKAAEYPRFVIQKHAASRLQYDLRLEVDGVFKSWAVTKGPSLDPRYRRLAVEVKDHPLDYGDFALGRLARQTKYRPMAALAVAIGVGLLIGFALRRS
jgi:bifunctional non-homologous end joining protein LigD